MSTIVATSLIEKLKEIQTTEGLSDYKFASRLGVSHQLWQMTRTGKREIGLTLLQGIIRAYPNLYQDVFLFLSSDVGITSQIAVDTTTHSQPSQDGKISRLSSLARGFILRLRSFFLFKRSDAP